MPSLVTQRIPALDGIRGIAILWVVAHNTLADFGTPPPGPLHIVALLTNPGWIGVQVFFALSGFLITGNLLDTQRASNYYSVFYIHRALRILPLYFVVLFALLVVVPALVETPAQLQCTADHQLWLWFFLSNWAPKIDCTDYGYGFAHFWSLAVEEQFYLFWPLLIYRLRPKPLVIICVAIAAVAMIGRSIAALNGVDSNTIYENTLFRMDALSLGSAAAALLRTPGWSKWAQRHIRVIGLSALVLFLAGVAFTRAYNIHGLSGQTIGYSILALTGAVLVGATALLKDQRTLLTTVLNWRPLRSVGLYSYAMYVFHVPLHKFVGVPLLASRIDGAPTVLVLTYVAAVTCVTYALSVLSYHLLEKRFLDLKKHFAPRVTATAESALS